MLNGNKKQIETHECLKFIKQIEVFKTISLLSMLPIASKLKKQKFKLGQEILRAGTVPQGLYIIQTGQCKVGMVKHVPYEVIGKEDAWNKPKEVGTCKYAVF